MCPGEAKSVSPGTNLVITGDTTGASDKFMAGQGGVGNCMNPLNAPGSDLVYAVTPTASGKLTAALDATYDHAVVRVTTKCPGAGSDEIACQYNTGAGTATTPQIDVTSGTTYYVVADSWMSKAGTFTLTLTLQ